MIPEIEEPTKGSEKSNNLEPSYSALIKTEPASPSLAGLSEEIIKNFLKSFVICNADVLCPCGTFCHGTNSNGGYIYREITDNSYLEALKKYGVDKINHALREYGVPGKLEIVFNKEDNYTADRILESEAKARPDDVFPVLTNSKHFMKKYRDTHPIAYCITARIDNIDIGYKIEEEYDIVGTTIEYYNSPSFSEKLTREVPKFGLVTKKIQDRYCTPEMTPYFVYFVPIISCRRCYCVFCAGIIEQTYIEKTQLIDQWEKSFQQAVNDCCLVCHVSHDQHYKSWQDEFRPYTILDTHIYLDDEDINNEVKKAYKCYTLFGYKIGKHGRSYRQIYIPKHHECSCTFCLRENVNNCLVRSFTHNTYLTNYAFQEFINELKKTYEIFSKSINDRHLLQIRAAISRKY